MAPGIAPPEKQPPDGFVRRCSKNDERYARWDQGADHGRTCNDRSGVAYRIAAALHCRNEQAPGRGGIGEVRSRHARHDHVDDYADVGEPAGDVPDERLGQIDEALRHAADQRQVAHQDEEGDCHQDEVVDALPQRCRQRRKRNWRGRKPKPDHGRADQHDRDRHAQQKERDEDDDDVPQSAHPHPSPKSALDGSGSRPESRPTSRATV